MYEMFPCGGGRTGSLRSQLSPFFNRIEEAAGCVFVVEQNGPFRKDQFNAGNTTRQFDVLLGPATRLEVTGANPTANETKGTLLLETEQGGEAEVVEFVVETGQTKAWDFPGEKRLTRVHVKVGLAEGAVRISTIQPTPKEIDVQELTVATGQTKCYVDDARALKLTMTAGSEPVKGTIRLERADRFSSNLEIDLEAGETRTWTVAPDKQTVTASFDLSAGSAKVVLDQSG